ncbi:protease [Wenjunlia tyrosinilytica]|uniref:Protease n=2 Tax=Wenjunlia tyrosinilytica TaxID=1544741 RepID=A0A917ZR13_9ACTN|nr:immune inhibitor A domain-containing protein [Wenjunlia tyrosinilytica]GGO89226.1 protease [Wenjunlia tyrosinilytica]
MAAALVAALGAAALPSTALASAAPEGAAHRDPAAAPADHGKHVEHNLPGPLTKRENARRQAAVEKLVSGDARITRRGASKSVKLGKGKYVEFDRQKTDKIFTVLVQFGDTVDSTTMYDPDGDGPQPPVVKYGGEPGPQHNQIPKPDRKTNNTTIWQKDFNRKHFQDLYFAKKGTSSVAKYYEKQSSGRYSVDGEVADWVKVKYNEARYGSNYCGQSNCSNVWDLVRDGVNQWAEDQKAQGKTDEQIKKALAAYDKWDRYDFDHDGDFNEPDGYIDHFQIVHAGEDESAGGGAQGTNALWAHRWYAYGSDAGKTGPADNKLGGTEIGKSGIWVGDYTLQPENGGLGVYAHEFGHDLGLPDHYDTTYKGENSSGFWTLMSSGSWLSEGKTDIGSRPGDMSAWDKLQLGWLNFATGKAATKSTHTLGVAEYNTKNKQGLVVKLPKKSVTTTIAKPAEGTKQWWSGSGNDLKNTLTRSVDLTGKAKADLSLKGWFDIEQDYDFLYTEVSTDGGKDWTALDGTVDGKALPRDGSGAPALTGVSGKYTDLAFPLDAYAGKKFDLRFRYTSDGGVAGKGFTADAIKLTADGGAVFTDGAEGGDNGWTAAGFSRIGESFTKKYAEYYIAENRQYVSYDKVLRTGPYNFGWASTKPDWVERFAYQNGLLISLWDTSQTDNNVGDHPGEGLILPIDAHAKPLHWKDGTLLRTRIQGFDSTFSLKGTDALTVHKEGVAKSWKAKKGNPTFDDRTGTYWYPETQYASVKVPNTDTIIKILWESKTGQTMKVRVDKSKK